MAKVLGPAGVPDVGKIGPDPGVRVPEQVFSDAYGYDVGEAVRRFGATGYALAEKMEKERQEQNDHVFYATAATRYQTKARDALRELQKSVQPGAPDFTKQYDARLKEIAAQIKDETVKELKPTKRALGEFDARVMQWNAPLIEHAAVYEDKERKALNVDKISDNINRVSIAAQQGTMTHADALREAGSILADGQRSLLPDEYRDLKRKAERMVSTSYLLGMAERNPGQALAIARKTDAGTLASWGVTADDMRRVEHAADAQITKHRQRGLLDRAEIREGVSAWEDSRKGGDPVAPDVEKNLDTKIRATGNKDLIRQWETKKSFYDRTDAYRGSSIPELVEAEKTLRAPGTTTEDLRVANFLRASLRGETTKTEREYTQLQHNLLQMALKGEALPKADLDKAYQLGKDLDATGNLPPERLAITSRIENIAERVSAAQKSSPAQFAEKNRQRATAESLAKIEGPQPEPDSLQISERNAIATVLQHKITERDADPQAFVRKYDDAIREGTASADPAARAAAATRSIEAQLENGVRPEKVALLTKPEMADFERKLAETNQREWVDAIRQMRDRYPTQELWKQVSRELARGKDIPESAKVVAAMPWGKSPGKDEENYKTAMDLREADLAAKAGWKDLFIETGSFNPLSGFKDRRAAADAVGIMNDKTRVAMREAARTFMFEPGGPQRADRYGEAATRLAMLYATRGMPAEDAIKKATNAVFYGDYEGVDRVRVPRDLDGKPIPMTGVRMLLDYAKEGLDKVEIEPSLYLSRYKGMEEKKGYEQIAKKARSEFVASAKDKGFWMTAPDGEGAIYMTDQGTPLILKGSTRENPRYYRIDFRHPDTPEFRAYAVKRVGETPVGANIVTQMIGVWPAVKAIQKIRNIAPEPGNAVVPANPPRRAVDVPQ